MTSIFDPFRKGRFLGFDAIFDQLDRAMTAPNTHVKWPPYNLSKITTNLYQLQFALAGFSKDEISVRLENDHLVIEGRINNKKEGPQFLHQGISMKDFIVKFLVADGFEVSNVCMDNGMLLIDVKHNKEEPKSVEFEIKAADDKSDTVRTQPTSDLMDAARDEGHYL